MRGNLGAILQRTDAWVINGGFDGGAASVVEPGHPRPRSAAAGAAQSKLLAVAPLLKSSATSASCPTTGGTARFGRGSGEWTLEAVDAGLASSTHRALAASSDVGDSWALARSSHPVRAATVCSGGCRAQAGRRRRARELGAARPLCQESAAAATS